VLLEIGQPHCDCALVPEVSAHSQDVNGLEGVIAVPRKVNQRLVGRAVVDDQYPGQHHLVTQN
jgi:hypothetical protein